MKLTVFLSWCLLFLISCNKQAQTLTTAPLKEATIAQSEAKEVLLIGTFHYHNPGADVAKTKSFDILSEKSQKELEQITLKIKQYNPTKIFVEWLYKEQPELDSLYQLYQKDNYFTNDSLSSFYLKNEIFQLAFRVAKANNLDKVYAVDYKDTEFPFEAVMQAIVENDQVDLKEEIEAGIATFTTEFDNKIDAGVSLKELMYHVNRPEMRLSLIHI